MHDELSRVLEQVVQEYGFEDSMAALNTLGNSANHVYELERNGIDDYWLGKVPLFVEYRRMCSYKFFSNSLGQGTDGGMAKRIFAVDEA